MFVYECKRVCVNINTTAWTGWWEALAERLQLGPWVDTTYFYWWIVMEDVVAQVLQWRLGVGGGKLSSIFNFFPHFYINLLQWQCTQSVKQYRGICQKAVQKQCFSLFYLELLNTGHVVAEHAILQHGDGVTFTTDLLYLIACTIAEKGQIGAGVL